MISHGRRGSQSAAAGPTPHRFAGRVSRSARHARACRVTDPPPSLLARTRFAPRAGSRRSAADVTAASRATAASEGRASRTARIPSTGPAPAFRRASPRRSARLVLATGTDVSLFTRAHAPSASHRHLLIGKRVSERRGSTSLAETCSRGMPEAGSELVTDRRATRRGAQSKNDSGTATYVTSASTSSPSRVSQVPSTAGRTGRRATRSRSAARSRARRMSEVPTPQDISQTT